MYKLSCTQCNSTVEWDGTSEVVTCPYCGARFQMKSRAGSSSQAKAPQGGCVMDLPATQPVAFNDIGAVYYRSWLPQGWSYNILCPTHLYYGASATSPFTPAVAMLSPDGLSSITHVTSNGYQDPGPMGRILPGNGEIGIDGLIHYPASVMDPRTFVRIRPLISAANYCDELALRSNYADLQVVSQDEPDDFVQQRIEGMLAQASQEVRDNHWYDWCRRTYRGLKEGTPYRIVVETQISTNGFNVPRQMQQPQDQGFFGRMAGAFGQAANFASQMRMWRTDFDLFLIAPEAQADALMDDFERVRRTIELGPDFARMQSTMESFLMQQAMQAQNITNNAIAQMQADQMASWDRMRATISDTNAYTTNVMHEINASTAATNDRVARGMSETIREVNTYGGAYGPVEASIQYDHVWQHTPTGGYPNDTYIAVEGEWLEPGVDFTELPKL